MRKMFPFDDVIVDFDNGMRHVLVADNKMLVELAVSYR